MLIVHISVEEGKSTTSKEGFPIPANERYTFAMFPLPPDGLECGAEVRNVFLIVYCYDPSIWWTLEGVTPGVEHSLSYMLCGVWEYSTILL